MGSEMCIRDRKILEYSKNCVLDHIDPQYLEVEVVPFLLKKNVSLGLGQLIKRRNFLVTLILAIVVALFLEVADILV